MSWPPIPEGDPSEKRHEDGRWHMGCMITQQRAIAVATILFPDEVADGSDCRNEYGREGQPCRACADRNEAWVQRVRQVRLAMMEGLK